jgi:hypothetical protein
LYAWKVEGKGSQATAPIPEVDEQDPREPGVEKLQRRIAELERVKGPSQESVASFDGGYQVIQRQVTEQGEASIERCAKWGK